jgi:DNA-binding NarL/FixJ family response regulator
MEKRVVKAVMHGGTNREAAASLGLREQTVKNYLSRLYRKLGVRNRVELVISSSQYLREP